MAGAACVVEAAIKLAFRILPSYSHHRLGAPWAPARHDLQLTGDYGERSGKLCAVQGASPMGEGYGRATLIAMNVTAGQARMRAAQAALVPLPCSG